MANTSRGLLPQLVDLLYALADSQALLTRRVQQAHVELLGVPSSDGGNSGQADPHQTARAEPPPSVLAAPEHDPCEPLSSETAEWTIASSSVYAPDPSSAPGLQSSTVVPNHPEASTAPTPSEVSTPVDDFDACQDATPTRLEDLEPASTDAEDDEPVTRSYNFFDELDARLANLRTSENESEETAS